MDYIEIRRKVLLSFQRALLGMIYPDIRAIAVGFQETKKLTVFYYLDREPNNDDYDNLSDVTGEVLGDIDFSEVEEKCFFTKDLIRDLNSLDSWVYVRKE